MESDVNYNLNDMLSVLDSQIDVLESNSDTLSMVSNTFRYKNEKGEFRYIVIATSK